MSEWRDAGSIRRTATVTISVPLASIASASVSMRGKPPVPRMSREANGTPAMCSVVAHPPCTAVTASTFDPAGHRERRPRALRDDLAVDGDRDAAGVGVDAEVPEQLGDRRAVALPHLAPVDEDHAVTSREAAGARTREPSGASSPLSARPAGRR